MASGPRGSRRRLRFETRIFLLVLLAGLPALGVLTWVLFATGFETASVVSILLPLGTLWLWAAARARATVTNSLFTLANLLEAVREGDYSLRGRRADRDDAMGAVVWEVNTLTQTMRDQRLRAEEASALLVKVIAELDIAVFAFDGVGRLKLANRAGAELMARRQEDLPGRSAKELGLYDLLRDEGVSTQERAFPARAGRWEIRHQRFREGGLPHHLVVITDLSRALRAEERKAWQRLIRVMGHELNNSLAPIKSMAALLRTQLAQSKRAEDWEDDLASGLSVIGDRAEALSRFVAAYARLARLPSPRPEAVDVRALVERVARLDRARRVRVTPGPDIRVNADPDQIEQLLINLMKNALEATEGSTQQAVELTWRVDGLQVAVEVRDRGVGLANTDNVFVPFFTTKPGGSGIGLVLSRQIAEAHGGTVTLANRDDGDGCIASLRLPI